MKLMKRKILQGNYPVNTPEDHLRAYFAMSENQLKRIEGDTQTILSAQLTRMLKEQGCKCPMNYCGAFRKLESTVLYEVPEIPNDSPLDRARSGSGAK